MNPISLESPFPLYAMPRVWAWMQATLARKMDDAAPKTFPDFIQAWIAAEERPGRRSWAVSRDGVIGGILFSDRITDYVADLHVIFKKEFYGHKTTQQALAMVLGELYAPEGEPGVIKIESKVLPDNRAVISLVCSVGGSKEGLARGHTLRDGKPIDVVMVGIERSKFNDWNRRRVQLAGHEQPVPAVDDGKLDDQRGEVALPERDPARHLRHAPPVPHESAGGGQPGENGRPQPGQ